MISFYIGKTFKHKDGYIGKVIDVKWVDGLYFRLDNYHTYNYFDLEFFEYNLVYEDGHYCDSDKTFLSKEICLEYYSGFEIKKTQDTYYHGIYQNKPAYIRQIPIWDKFYKMHYLGVGLKPYNSLGKLILNLAENDFIVKIEEQKLAYLFEKEIRHISVFRNPTTFSFQKNYFGLETGIQYNQLGELDTKVISVNNDFAKLAGDYYVLNHTLI